MTNRLTKTTLAIMFVSLLGADAPAAIEEAPAPVTGPHLEIAVGDELVLPSGESRAMLRDEAGHLVTRPGDVIRYRLTASNVGTDPARNTELVDPIPAGTEYVIGSARGDGMQLLFSIDGGRTFAPQPVRYQVHTAAGERRELAAEPQMYTHVKWHCPNSIPPGNELEASFEVRVSGQGDGDELERMD